MFKHPPVTRTDPCEVSDVLSSWTFAMAAGSASPSGATVTTPAEAVGSSIWRLSHHYMMSGNVCDGFALVRRPHNGRGIMKSLTRSPWGVVG